MNKEIKQKWITALRSGAYTQVRYLLSKGDCKYCAIGVLCDLFSKETGKGKFISFPDSEDGKLFVLEDDANDSFDALMRVAEWAEMDFCTDMREISAKNDCGVQFNVIADHIESRL